MGERFSPSRRSKIKAVSIGQSYGEGQVKGDLRIEFVRQDLTSYGGLELLRRYIRRLGLPARLRTACATVGGDYGGARLALLVMSLF